VIILMIKYLSFLLIIDMIVDLK